MIRILHGICQGSIGGDADGDMRRLPADGTTEVKQLWNKGRLPCPKVDGIDTFLIPEYEPQSFLNVFPVSRLLPGLLAVAEAAPHIAEVADAPADLPFFHINLHSAGLTGDTNSHERVSFTLSNPLLELF